MNSMSFKGFLLIHETKAILENVWADMLKPATMPAAGSKIPLETKIANLKAGIAKRNDQQNLLRTQIKQLEKYSRDFPSDKKSVDVQIASINRTIGELYGQITLFKKELEKISSEEISATSNATQQSGDQQYIPGSFTASDQERAKKRFGDYATTVPWGIDQEKGEVITAANPKWNDYERIQRGKKTNNNPPALPKINVPSKKPWFTGRSW